MSRARIVVGAVMAVAVAASVSLGEVNYWDKIEGLLIAADKSPDAAKAADAYLRSLSQEQLILAARQCSTAMIEKFPPSEWDMAGSSLGFFYQYYPMAEGGLANLEPLWRELDKEGGNAFWQRSLVHLLTSAWREKYTHEQAIEMVKRLGDIFADTRNSIHVRSKIPLSLAHFIAAERERTATAKLQDEEFSKLIAKTSHDFMRIFGELTTPVTLKREILAL